MEHFDLSKFDATPTHYFIKMLQDKGLLYWNLTQNIDNLEEKTGMNMDTVLQCHGANSGASCAACCKPADMVLLQKSITEKTGPMYCEKCKAPVKPNIVFFGEDLPKKFGEIV